MNRPQIMSRDQLLKPVLGIQPFIREACLFRFQHGSFEHFVAVPLQMLSSPVSSVYVCVRHEGSNRSFVYSDCLHNISCMLMSACGCRQRV